MQTPRPINDPTSGLVGLIAIGLSLLLLLGQAFFIVPAGKVAVVTTPRQSERRLATAGSQLQDPIRPGDLSIRCANPGQAGRICDPDQGSSGDRGNRHCQICRSSRRSGPCLSHDRQYDREVYPRIIQPSLLKALKSVFSQYELVTIATEWNDISSLVERTVAEELDKFDYVDVRGLDLTGLQIAEEYRAAIEQKQIAEQQLLRAQTEVKIAEQEAIRYDTLNRSLDDQVLFKLFLDKWDGQTEVVPALPGTVGGTPPVIVGRKS